MTGDPSLAAVMDERRQLLNVAYRLLGSLADAEDAVQESYTRWFALSRKQRAEVRRPGAWLTTVASRICLDQLGSARSRRERYVGEWIPEPLPDGEAVDPADRITLDESVGMAFLVVLEAMTPAERVAFVLHDVFRYSFAEVAAIVGRSTGACRQLASSARRRVADARVTTAPAEGQAAVVRDFKRAWEAGDVPALVGLLDAEVTGVADGGGRVNARRQPIVGAETIARYLMDIAARLADTTILERTVSGRPGLVLRVGDETVSVLAFEVVGERITRMWAQRNPEKLRSWNDGARSRPRHEKGYEL